MNRTRSAPEMVAWFRIQPAMPILSTHERIRRFDPGRMYAERFRSPHVSH